MTLVILVFVFFFFFQAEDGIRDIGVTEFRRVLFRSSHREDRNGEVDLPDAIFNEKPNMPVMHQAYLRQLANARQGTASTKTREIGRASCRERVEIAVGAVS